jgi:hypothetical protein
VAIVDENISVTCKKYSTEILAIVMQAKRFVPRPSLLGHMTWYEPAPIRHHTFTGKRTNKPMSRLFDPPAVAVRGQVEFLIFPKMHPGARSYV